MTPFGGNKQMQRGFIFFQESMAKLHFNYSGLLSFDSVKDKLLHFGNVLSKHVYIHAILGIHGTGPLLILMKHC